ncbi:MAG: hypothetical protein AAF849_16850 [Bacteroidota bacterium]
MSSLQLRSEIDTYLDQIDGSFLKVVHSMLSTYVEEKAAVIGYKTSGEPLLAEEAKTIFKQRLIKMDEGDYLTVDELEKESETW